MSHSCEDCRFMRMRDHPIFFNGVDFRFVPTMFVDGKEAPEEASQATTGPCGDAGTDLFRLVIPLTVTMGGILVFLAAVLVYQLVRIRRLQTKLRSSRSDISLTYLSGRPILPSREQAEPPSDGITNYFVDPNFPDGQVTNASSSPGPRAQVGNRRVNSMMLPPSYTMTSAATREILLRAACDFYPPPPYSEVVTPSSTPVPPPSSNGTVDASGEILYINSPTPESSTNGEAVHAPASPISSTTPASNSGAASTVLSVSTHSVDPSNSSSCSASPSGAVPTISASISAQSGAPGAIAVTLDSWRYFVDGSPVAPLQLPVAANPDVVPAMETDSRSRRLPSSSTEADFDVASDLEYDVRYEVISDSNPPPPHYPVDSEQRRTENSRINLFVTYV